MFNKSKDPLQPINPLQPKGGTPAMNKETYNAQYKEQMNVLKVVIGFSIIIVLSSIGSSYLPFIPKDNTSFADACKAKGGSVISIPLKQGVLCATYTVIDIPTTAPTTVPTTAPKQ